MKTRSQKLTWDKVAERAFVQYQVPGTGNHTLKIIEIVSAPVVVHL